MLPCIGGIWFLVIAPLRWGAIIGGNPNSANEYLVFRSEDPRRFWSIWRLNVLMLIAGFAIAIWCSAGSIRHLRHLQAALNETAAGNGAVAAPAHSALPLRAVPEQ